MDTVLEVLAQVLAGLIGIPVANWLKAHFKLQDKAAVLVAVFTAIGLSALAVWITGGFSFVGATEQSIRAALGTVFVTANLTYKLIVTPGRVTIPPQ